MPPGISPAAAAMIVVARELGLGGCPAPVPTFAFADPLPAVPPRRC